MVRGFGFEVSQTGFRGWGLRVRVFDFWAFPYRFSRFVLSCTVFRGKMFRVRGFAFGIFDIWGYEYRLSRFGVSRFGVSSCMVSGFVVRGVGLGVSVGVRGFKGSRYGVSG